MVTPQVPVLGEYVPPEAILIEPDDSLILAGVIGHGSARHRDKPPGAIVPIARLNLLADLKRSIAWMLLLRKVHWKSSWRSS
jgi:hypothetical protein